MPCEDGFASKTHIRGSAVTPHQTSSPCIGAAVPSQLRREPIREQIRALQSRRRPRGRVPSVSRETASSVVTVALSVIDDTLASDETVAIAGFGTFSPCDWREYRDRRLQDTRVQGRKDAAGSGQREELSAAPMIVGEHCAARGVRTSASRLR